MKRLALTLFVVHALACLSTAQVAENQWRFSKRNANGTYTDYGLTAVNGQAIGFTGGVPSMLTLSGGAWGSITGTLSSQIDLQTALDAKLATSTAASTYQPLDSDLTAIAALTTTSFGRELLTRADAAATRSALGLGTLATQSATISDYLTLATAASTYQPLASRLTSIANLADASGVLTNNGSGTFSYTATSTGGNTFGTDAGKIAVYGSLGEFSITSALRIAAGPSVMGIWFNNARLASAAGSNVRTWTLPDVTGTLITTGDTGTVTSAMLASGAAASLGANTFTGLQQFSGTDHAGLRLNNLTTTQRDAIGTPTAGMIIWNTTAARIQAYNGSAWTAGMVRLDGDTMTGALVLPAGTVSAPALTFGDSTTGLYRTGTNEVALGTAGTQRIRVSSAGEVAIGATSGSYLSLVTNSITGGFINSTSGRPSLTFGVGLGSSIFATVGGISGNDCFGVSPSGGAANVNMFGVFSSNTAYTFTLGAGNKDLNGAYTGAGHTTAVIGGRGSSVTTGGAGGALTLTGGAAAGSGNNNGGSVTLTGGAPTGTGTRGNVLMPNLPTSSAGLPSNALWNDGGTLKIVP